MKVLFITWEFPPLISGGLGTACYGMAKALLRTGVELDLILPTQKEAYFPLREPEDADNPAIRLIYPEPDLESALEEAVELKERMELLGLAARPETYLTPGFSFREFWRSVPEEVRSQKEVMFSSLRDNLAGESDFFKKVQELTAKASALARELDFDLIHVHDWLTFPVGLILKELTGKPLVAHIHATEFDRTGGVGDERIHKIEYAGLSGADLIISVSLYTAQMVIDRYRIPADKIRVVHNAHSMATKSGIKQRIFRSPLVLFLGRITLQKGPDYFLEVARKVLAAHPETRFVMAGAGDMMTGVLRKSAAARLGPHFLFTDFLNRRQVDQVLRATDIFIMPSVSEPFGIVPLEAMAHGAVAIISKQSGVAEVLDNVYKIDFWDVDRMAQVVKELLENPEKRKALGRAGQEEVISIRWDEAAEKIRNTYRELL